MSKKQVQPAATGAKPQLLQPRTMRHADSEICATMLRIAPIGEYDGWHNYQPRRDGAITEATVQEWLSKLHTWEPPTYGGREGAAKAAREAMHHD